MPKRDPAVEAAAPGLLRCARNDGVDFGKTTMREPAVYIMANSRNGTLYTGVTTDLSRRAWEHREGRVRGFTTRYGCKLLVWYERYELMTDAIAREKQLKAGSRKAKLALIEAMNPQWRDLYEELAQ